MLILAGCAGPKQEGASAKFPALSAQGTNAANSKLIVTPDDTLTGEVIRVNEAARFVVLNFPLGTLPGLDHQLDVYRRGLKVGVVKVTGPRLNDSTVAEISEGEISVGDQARGR